MLIKILLTILYIFLYFVGFFRNWKKVRVTISNCCLRWTSASDILSKSYSLKGAVIVKTVQFRFQISNMTEMKDGNSGKEVANKK